MSRFKYLMVFASILMARDADFIHFSHVLHVEDEELECVTCHGDVTASTSLDYQLLPSMDVCADCHDVDDDESCDMCHARPDEPLAYGEMHQNSGLPFSHQHHLETFEDCAKCHAATLADEGDNPYQAWDESQCRQCHSSNKPRSHLPGWKDLHGPTVVDMEVNNCSLCHSPSYCDGCHTLQQFEPKIHPTDFMIRHGMESRLGIKDCFTCHDIATSCYTCHSQNQYMPVDHNLPGWVNLIPEDGGLHGAAAGDTPMTCKACHLDEKNETCMRCHQ